MTTTTNGDTQAKGRPCRILILEDDPDVRRLFIIAARLEPLHVDVVGVTSEARELYQRAKATDAAYDLLLLDIALPDETGLEFAKWVRATGDTSVLIAMVTAFDRVMNRFESEDVNAVGFWTKPFDPADLFGKIKEVCPVSHDDRRHNHGRRTEDGEP